MTDRKMDNIAVLVFSMVSVTLLLFIFQCLNALCFKLCNLCYCIKNWLLDVIAAMRRCGEKSGACKLLLQCYGFLF